MRQLLDPEHSRRGRWLASCTIAVAITLGWRTLDEGAGSARLDKYGMELAQQAAGQIEGLALEAGLQGAPDPLGRALAGLAQGPEPRHIRIAREPASTADGVSSNARGEVSLRKSLSIPGRDRPEGLRVTVGVPRRGFLGAWSSLGRDAMLLLVAVGIAAVLGLLLELRSTASGCSRLAARQVRLARLLPELRDALLAIGRRMRDLFGQLEAFGAASADATARIGDARAGFHESIRLSRRVSRQADDVAGSALHAEAALLNLMLEAGRIARQTGSSPYPVHLIHQQLIEVRSRSERLQREVRDLERALEPLTTDLDLAWNAASELHDSLAGVPPGIDQATSGMAEQATIFGKIREELAS